MTQKTYYKNPQFNLRIPQELKDAVAESAKENNRSINAEIIYRLEQSFLLEENNKRMQIEMDARDEAELDGEEYSDRDEDLYEALINALNIIDRNNRGNNSELHRLTKSKKKGGTKGY